MAVMALRCCQGTAASVVSAGGVVGGAGPDAGPADTTLAVHPKRTKKRPDAGVADAALGTHVLVEPSGPPSGRRGARASQASARSADAGASKKKGKKGAVKKEEVVFLPKEYIKDAGVSHRVDLSQPLVASEVYVAPPVFVLPKLQMLQLQVRASGVGLPRRPPVPNVCTGSVDHSLPVHLAPRHTT